MLKALIKLAAAGVKVREGRENGVRTHCRRAALSVRLGGRAGGARQLGLDLELWAERCRELAENPPAGSRSRRRRRHASLCVSDRTRAERANSRMSARTLDSQTTC